MSKRKKIPCDCSLSIGATGWAPSLPSIVCEWHTRPEEPQPILLKYVDWKEGEIFKIDENGWHGNHYIKQIGIVKENGITLLQDDMTIEVTEDCEVEYVLNKLKSIDLSRRPVVFGIETVQGNSWDSGGFSFKVDAYRSLTDEEEELISLVRKQIPLIEENLRQKDLKKVKAAKEEYERLRGLYGEPI